MTKKFKEQQYEFLLRQCATQKQRDSLNLIRDLFKNSLSKEYSETRRIYYDGLNHKKVALIRIEKQKSNPEIIIKLPINTNFKRHGFELQTDGCPGRKVLIYKERELRFKQAFTFQEITEKKLTQEMPQDNFEKLIQLIQITLENYGREL